jgi:hypothetical protein
MHFAGAIFDSIHSKNRRIHAAICVLFIPCCSSGSIRILSVQYPYRVICSDCIWQSSLLHSTQKMQGPGKKGKPVVAEVKAPRWKNFERVRYNISEKDKRRMDNLVWRAWHMHCMICESFPVYHMECPSAWFWLLYLVFNMECPSACFWFPQMSSTPTPSTSSLRTR